MVMVGISVYFAILYMFREFRREDFHFFMDTLNVRRMFRYIMDEIRK